MNRISRLATPMATALALATIFGTSVFAEERPQNATAGQAVQEVVHHDRQWRNRDGQQSQPQAAQQQQQSQQQQYRNRGNESGSQTWQRDRANRDQNQNQTRTWNRDQVYNNNNNRQYDRNQTYNNNNRQYDRSQTYNNNRQYDRSQTYNNRGYDRGRSNQSYDRRGNDGYRTFQGHRYDSRGWGDRYDSRGRRSFFSEGRVTRYVHERGGYRVWIDGGLYPFWIPEARWRLFPLRVGISIGLGGWYDPLGYVDVYDVGPYAYSGAYATSGELRGVVESVDYRRGTIVIRDDISGNFVTAVMRGSAMGDFRPGDYVDFGGDWSRAGVFNAYQLLNVQGGQYGGPQPY